MRVVDLIEAKRDGQILQAEQIHKLIQAYTADEVPDYQMSALLMAIYLKGLNDEELAAWTEAMLHSGRVLDLSHLPGLKVDKHSTGGVGDKISLPLAPLVAACGLKVPMISGRGLGHTGGTLDKLESIPGFTTGLPLPRFLELLDTLNLGLIGQTEEIAPADKRIYALRDVTGTVSSIPLITSSILSKKLAEGIDALVLDVKVGSGAFMRTEADARALATRMVAVSRQMGTKAVALLTDMDQPLGQACGNSIEVIESIEVLRGKGPEDVRQLTLALAEEMLQLGGLDPSEAARALGDGRGLERFRQIIEAQGGDPKVIDDYSRLPQAPHTVAFKAQRSGYVQHIDSHAVGVGSLLLGAGRLRSDEPVDPRVGVTVLAKVGARVQAGETIALIHHADRAVESALARLQSAWQIGDEAPAARPLIIDRIDP